MKKLYLLFLFFIFPFCHSAAAMEVGSSDTEIHNEMTYFYCDFENGIPDEFNTYDGDGQTLHFSMVQSGFEQGDAWIAKREERVQKVNYYAASASKYKYGEGETPQPSDDWLITPLIRIRGGNAVLTWRSNSICEQKKNMSSYKVLISTIGNNPEDFKEEPVFSVEEEAPNQWTNHEISLAQYAGQKIYIAFVNISLDKEILAIDDLEVKGEKGFCEISVNTGSYVFGEDAITVEGSVTAYSDKPVTEFTAYYTYQEQTFSKHVSGISLGKYESYPFVFDEKIPVQFGDTVRYQVWADVNGELQDKINCQTVSFLFRPQRKTVIEEGTGMWCVYCPKGIVAMDILTEKYPEQFIGLALHYSDPMEVKDYVDSMDFPGFPSGRVNRKYLVKEPMVVVEENGIKMYTTLEGGFETYFLKAQQEPTVADLSVNAEIVGNRIKASAISKFAVNASAIGYQLAFAITEDGVTDPAYYQDNGFSGGDILLGGYESLPGRIESPVFEHVARGIYADYRGIPGSIPADIELGVDYLFEYTIDIPKSIKNLKNIKVIAMLIDMSTGEIVNANSIGSLPVGMEKALSAVPSLLTCSQDGNDCLVDFTTNSSSPVIIRIYDSMGNLIAQEVAQENKGHLLLRIPSDGKSGLHIITAEQDNRIMANKLIFK